MAVKSFTQATMLSLAGSAPLPADPAAPMGSPLEALQPLAAWFRGAFRLAPPAAEVTQCLNLNL